MDEDKKRIFVVEECGYAYYISEDGNEMFIESCNDDSCPVGTVCC